jgi:hypothetical protein
MKRMLLTTAALCAAVMIPFANAGTQTWRADAVGSSNWNNAANWTASDGASEDAVPTSADLVVFPDKTSGTYTVTMDAAPGYAQRIDMHSDATLSIGSYRLDVGSADTSPAQSSTINGQVLLTSSSSILRFVYDHSVSGSGSITGSNNSASIEIGDTKLLTSYTTIQGALQIVDDSSDPNAVTVGSFTNSGLVHANVSGTLKLAVAGTVDDGNVVVDSDDDRWQSSSDGSATLWLSSDIGTLDSLDGDFLLSDGTIKIDKALTTLGQLYMTGGTFDVNENTHMGQDFIQGQQAARNMDASGGTIDVESGNTFEHE